MAKVTREGHGNTLYWQTLVTAIPALATHWNHLHKCQSGAPARPTNWCGEQLPRGFWGVVLCWALVPHTALPLTVTSSWKLFPSRNQINGEKKCFLLALVSSRSDSGTVTDLKQPPQVGYGSTPLHSRWPHFVAVSETGRHLGPEVLPISSLYRWAFGHCLNNSSDWRSFHPSTAPTGL